MTIWSSSGRTVATLIIAMRSAEHAIVTRWSSAATWSPLAAAGRRQCSCDRTSCHGRIAAQHGHARAIFRATQRYHVLADMSRDDLSTMSVCVSEDVLDKVVAKLIAGDYNC